MVVTGDLTDTGHASEYGLFRTLVARHLSMPVFVIPGNHDDREEFRQTLADFPGVTDDPRFIQYVVEDLPVRLIMLDTVVPGADHGELCPDRLAFLDRALQQAPNRPTMVAMHHPPFSCGIGHMDRIGLIDPAAFVAIIARNPQVERVICGHHHRHVVGRVAHAIAVIAPSVSHQVELDLREGAAGAFVMEPPAYQLHRWTESEGIVSHTAYVERWPGPFPFVSGTD
ncbi:MAG: phosphodiesterase [Acetobacteraceae bacterium]|nr:phosphodiesterase [Acetobacteraceae bacterium]